MTRRREIEKRRGSLGEIRNIMDTMKTLAYMETRKLTRILGAQRGVVTHIVEVASDFLDFFSNTLPGPRRSVRAYLLLGSERGFCGDFNEALVTRMESHAKENTIADPFLIAIGNRLGDHILQYPHVVALLDGPNVVEETESVLSRFVNTLAGLQSQYSDLSLCVVYHDPQNEEIVIDEVLPPFEKYRNTMSHYAHPPVLNLSPGYFLAELIDHYLFSVLHRMLSVSLMAENLRRVQILEGAVHHLDDESTELMKKINVLRQEEIIEEIEIILLNTKYPDQYSQQDKGV